MLVFRELGFTLSLLLSNLAKATWPAKATSASLFTSTSVLLGRLRSRTL